jgi:hypothetical protein
MIENIKLTEKSAEDYAREGQNNVATVLKQLDDEFTKLIDIIKDKYNHSKKTILELYGDSNTINDCLMEEINWTKTTYVDRLKNLPRSS